MILMDCNNIVLGNVLGILRNILNIIWIVGPILAILSLTVNFIKMAKDPDDKKLPKNIKNSFIALIILFLVPTIVNGFMLILDKDSEISACWSGDINPSGYDAKYINPYGDKKKNSVIEDPDNYEPGNERKEDDSFDYGDGATVTDCGSLEYCNRFLTSMVNNSKRLNDAILKNNARVEYNYGKSEKSWAAAIKKAERGQTVYTTCVVPANWGFQDVIGNHRVIYTNGPGSLRNYSGEITKYTKQIIYNGSITLKDAILKGLIQPGDYLGVPGHDFAIYKTNKDGSAVVFDGGHQFTNKCQRYRKCYTMFTYSAKQNSGYKILQIMRWVK